MSLTLPERAILVVCLIGLGYASGFMCALTLPQDVPVHFSGGEWDTPDGQWLFRLRISPGATCVSSSWEPLTWAAIGIADADQPENVDKPRARPPRRLGNFVFPD